MNVDPCLKENRIDYLLTASMQPKKSGSRNVDIYMVLGGGEITSRYTWW